MKEDPLFVTALARGLDVLRCFTAERPEMGSTEIARLLGLPQPTVWRLCKTLSQLGYLVPGHIPDRLRVGAAVLLLGHAAITHTGMNEFALPLMKELADQFGASVSLGERNRGNMVIVQRSEAVGIVKVNLYIGSTIPMTNSSLGLAYLSALGEAERAAVLEQIRTESPQAWAEHAPHVRQALKDYQERGFVFNMGVSHRDINAVGVPVISPDGKRVMALTCGGARSGFNKDRLVSQVAPALMALAARLAPLAG